MSKASDYLKKLKTEPESVKPTNTPSQRVTSGGGASYWKNKTRDLRENVQSINTQDLKEDRQLTNTQDLRENIQSINTQPVSPNRNTGKYAHLLLNKDLTTPNNSQPTEVKKPSRLDYLKEFGDTPQDLPQYKSIDTTLYETTPNNSYVEDYVAVESIDNNSYEAQTTSEPSHIEQNKPLVEKSPNMTSFSVGNESNNSISPLQDSIINCDTLVKDITHLTDTQNIKRSKGITAGIGSNETISEPVINLLSMIDNMEGTESSIDIEPRTVLRANVEYTLAYVPKSVSDVISEIIPLESEGSLTINNKEYLMVRKPEVENEVE